MKCRIILVSFLLLAFATFGYSKDLETPLTLLIRAGKTTYFLNDKVRIVFEYKNVSEKEIKFIPYIYGENWISVYDANDKFMKGRRIKREKIMPLRKKSVVVLKPQQQYFQDITGNISKYKYLSLNFNEHSEILLKSGYGQYKIKLNLKLPLVYYYENNKKIRYKDLWTGTLTSNEIIINIKPY